MEDAAHNHLNQYDHPGKKTNPNYLTVAFTAADPAPWVTIYHWQILMSSGSERIIEVVFEASWLIPFQLWVPQEHSKKVSGASLPASTVRGASMHDAQIVDELDIPLLAVEFDGEPLR